MNWANDIKAAIEQYEEDVLTLIEKGYTKLASEKLEEVISLMQFAYQEMPIFEIDLRLQAVTLIDRWDQLQDLCIQISNKNGRISPNQDIAWLIAEHLEDIEEHLSGPEPSPTIH